MLDLSPSRGIRRSCEDIDRIDDVGAIVLAADGTFSVIKQLGSGASALADVPELAGSNSANRSDDE